jgi:putative ABC transport system permease protein
VNARNVLTVRIPAPDRPVNVQVSDVQRRETFVNELLHRLQALPAVKAVGYIDWLPLTRGTRSFRYEVENEPQPVLPRALTHIVSAGYFPTMEVPIKRGRVFESGDVRGSLPVAVINEALAQRIWPGENPLGRRIRQTGPDSRELWFHVIGVVGDVRDNLAGLEREPEVYLSSLQMGTESMRATVVLRSESGLSSLIPTVKRAVSELDRTQAMMQVQTMEQVLARSIAPQRFNLAMIGLLACIALLLAAAGIYGVVSYSVAQRAHEIGVRMALGAQQRNVLSLVIGQGMRLASAGILIGIVGACALMRVMSGLLHEVKPTDPLTFIGVSLLLASTAFVACWLPARRAAQIAPMEALRHE